MRRCSKYPMKVWVSLERKFLMSSSHSGDPERPERIFPAWDSVCPWRNVSFVRTAAESTWRAKLERAQHSACICPSWFPREHRLRVRPLITQRVKNFFERWRRLRLLKMREPMVNVCCGDVESAGRSGVTKCVRDLSHFTDKSPGFRSVILDSL